MLDRNCIIDVEERRPRHVFVEPLIELHRAKEISIKVPATMGIERLQDKTNPHVKSFTTFQQKLEGIGLGDAEVLDGPVILGIMFLGRARFIKPEDLAVERTIFESMFPTIEYEYKKYCLRRGLSTTSQDLKYLNRRCDSLTLWSHVHYGCDFFVTADKKYLIPKLNFIKNILPTADAPGQISLALQTFEQ